MRAPALVSPSAPGANGSVTSPVSPQSVMSSPREAAASTPVPAAACSAQAAAVAAASVNVVTSKPPRPYTEYTMFYQLEREYILHCVLPKDGQEPPSPAAPNNQAALFQNDPLMPARYRSLPLRADWYISGKTKKPTKRKHRKSHGKIGFLELTRMIAARWANVDAETRKYCKMMAEMELVKYKEDMESYNQYKERLSALGEIPEDMKERMMKKRKAQEKKDASKKAKTDGAAKSDSPGAKSLPPLDIKAEAVLSAPAAAAAPIKLGPAATAAIKLEPLSHSAPLIQHQASNLDNDMEQFITSLVRSPNRPANTKVITPDRSSAAKRRRLFRERSSGTAASAMTAGVDEVLVPLKDAGDDDHLDGIKMTFSGINEDEIAREFSDQVVHRPAPAAGGTAQGIKADDPSFDYWDALVGI